MSEKRRPKVLRGITYEIHCGCGELEITINNKNDLPFEIFVRLGKGGGCASSQCEAIARCISRAFKYSVPIKEIIKDLAGISCHTPSGIGDERVLSCSDGISRALKMHLEEMDNNLKKEKL